MTKISLSSLIALSHKHPIIFYDAQCLFCDGFVQWLIRRDQRGHFKFCSLQSIQAIGIPTEYNKIQHLSTVLMLDKGQWWDQSDVSLQILGHLGFGWRTLRVLKYIPSSIRNGFYNWFARHRYEWFGHSQECLVPSPDIRSRFLDQ